MSNLYNRGTNPIYESLLSSYETRNQISKKIQESTVSDMSPEDVRGYLMSILDALQGAVSKQVFSFPDDTIKQKVMSIFLERINKMTKNASVEDLVKSLQSFWSDLKKEMIQLYMQTPEAKLFKDQILEIYEKVDLGVKDLLVAYNELKTKAGDLLMDPSLIDFVNSKMVELEATITNSLSSTKSLVS